MNRINKHTFIYLVFCALPFALSGCADNMEPEAAGDSNSGNNGVVPLTIRATASGFQAPAPSGDSPTTRIPVMEGTSTTFQTDDAIGLFCIRKDASGNEYVAEDIRNLKMTYTAAADGTGTWEAPTAESAPLVYTDAVTYFAYYPYTEELTTASVSNEQTIRAWLKTNKPLATDMHTPDVLAANDLMTATALPSLAAADRGALALNFKHEYALLVVKPMGIGFCVPPAAVTAYSYHPNAKSNNWGIDKNVAKTGTNDFKMKINNGKACEMSDGTYRILTNATTSGSQISCDYTTYNNGLVPVTAIGSSISSGFQANTCYTLEVQVAGAIGEVERAVQPCDFVYQHNGKIEIYPGDGAVDANGKIPDYANAVGIVMTTDPTKMTDARCNSNGWNHAYVMGLENILGGPFLWAKETSLFTSLPQISADIAENDMNGYTETELMLVQSPLSNFPIFEALKKYRTDNPIPNNINRSPWFIPSVGQWFDVMTNLCGRSPNDFNAKDYYIWMTNNDQRIEMLAKADNQLAKVGTTLLMLPSPDIYSTGLWLSSQTNSKDKVWVFYGTDRTGTLSIEELGKIYGLCDTARPFFAF